MSKGACEFASSSTVQALRLPFFFKTKKKMQALWRRARLGHSTCKSGSINALLMQAGAVRLHFLKKMQASRQRTRRRKHA